MGGFVGGVVGADGQLSPKQFEEVVSLIKRRGTGPAFQRIVDLRDGKSGIASNSVVYLASAQESGFTDNGILLGDSPISDSVTLIDGFPSDRSITEVRSHVAGQRTVLPTAGPDLIERLTNDNGPFAFVSFDRNNGLTISRDFLGRKTLYIYRAESEYWFSTDLRTLLSIREIPRRPNPKSVYEYLRHGNWNASDQTLFEDVAQVPPGTLLDVDLKNPGHTTIRGLRSFHIPSITPLSFDDAVEATRGAFIAAIEHCIPVNQGPIAATLSGGTDSTSIVSAMRQIVGRDREFHTFSYITPDHERINEERWIDIAASASDAISHKVEIASDEYARDLPLVTREFGEPLIGTSQYLQFRLSQLLRQHNIRNVVDGVLGDSVTGGHHYFVFDRLRKAISERNFTTAYSLAQTIVRQVLNNPSRGYYVQALAQLPDPLHRAVRAALKLEAMPKWLNSEWFLDNGVSARLPRAFKNAQPFQSHIVAAMLGSRATRSAERNAAVNAAESRMPFLDASFVEFMLSLPEHYLFADDGQQRLVFKEAMSEFVPEPILNRTDKVGFEAPDNTWLSEQRDWANLILDRAKEINAPFILDRIPDDIGDQRVVRADIVRCLSLTVWADCHHVTF